MLPLLLDGLDLNLPVQTLEQDDFIFTDVNDWLMIYILQMTSNDKDFRFMATNDLMVELQKDSIKLDDDSERKVIFICSVCLNQEYSDILGQFGSCKY